MQQQTSVQARRLEADDRRGDDLPCMVPLDDGNLFVRTRHIPIERLHVADAQRTDDGVGQTRHMELGEVVNITLLHGDPRRARKIDE